MDEAMEAMAMVLMGMTWDDRPPVAIAQDQSPRPQPNAIALLLTGAHDFLLADAAQVEPSNCQLRCLDLLDAG
jgi:hypothetical protein